MIKITHFAKKQLIQLLKPDNLLRIYVASGGCNGIQWDFEYTKEKHKLDEIIAIDSKHSLLIDNRSVVFLSGSTLDYEQSLKSSEFVMKNPNAQNSCGCGKSFNL
jgi:iron-sulfur cluster assembly accessory protein